MKDSTVRKFLCGKKKQNNLYNWFRMFQTMMACDVTEVKSSSVESWLNGQKSLGTGSGLEY